MSSETGRDLTPALAAVSSADPIFILGISQRSGTNFLFDLLCLHPDCGAPSRNWEDFLLDKSDLLADYVRSVFLGWRRRGTADEVEDLLYEHLGSGLIEVLASRVKEMRVVTKTPSVRNLKYFFRFFPRAYLLILVRDGRAVVESRVKSFGESYETAMRRWAAGADTLLRFQESADRARQRYLIVRYEDLWKEPHQELRRIFGFVRLDPDRYDFNAAVDLPVRGSSTFHGAESRYHWKPVEKTADFDPLGRANHWSASTRERFEWIAGGKLERLGYGEMRQQEQLSLIVRNKLLDKVWQLSQLHQSTMVYAKRLLKCMFGAERISRYRSYVLGFVKTASDLRSASSR